MRFSSAVLGTATLAVLLTAGAAQSLAGSNTVFGDDIVNGTITTPDMKANSISGSRILNGAITGADLANNAVTTGKVAPDTLTGSDVNESTLAILRAYGVIKPNGTSTPTVSDAKNITGARRLAAGTYCVTLNPAAGVNVTTTTIQLTVNWDQSATSDFGLFALDGGTLGCVANERRVITGHINADGAKPISDDTVAFAVLFP